MPLLTHLAPCSFGRGQWLPRYAQPEFDFDWHFDLVNKFSCAGDYQLRGVEIRQTSEKLKLLVVPSNLNTGGPLADARADGLQ
jgi:hypothetical protein